MYVQHSKTTSFHVVFTNITTGQAVNRLFTEALAKWPRDPLRPDCQLHDVVGKRIERELAQAGGKATEAQLKQANALYSLLENRYQTKVRELLRLYTSRGQAS